MADLIVPAAVSSQLDDTGEERIHIANSVPGGVSRTLLLPQITGNIPDGFVGQVVNYQYSISLGQTPYGPTTISSGTLIPGCSMNSTGLVTGTRTTVSNSSWTVQMTDANGSIASLADSSQTSDPDVWFINPSYAGKYSADSWTVKTNPPVSGGYVHYLNGYIYITAGSGVGTAYSSNKGTSWTTNNAVSSSAGGGRMIEVGGFLFRCGGVNVMNRCASPFGTWSTPSADTRSRANTVVAIGTKLVVASIYASTVSISTDLGVNWTSGGAYSSSANGSPALIYNGSRLVVAYCEGASGFATGIKYSDDQGVTWSASQYSFPNPSLSNSIAHAAHDGTNFVVITATGQVAYSSDGITWTLSASTIGANCNQIAVGQDKLLTSHFAGLLYSSIDHGVTWSQRTDPVGSSDIQGVAWIYP